MDLEKKQFMKKRNEIIDFESVNDSDNYAITINPSDKFQYFKDVHRLGTFIENLNRILYNSSKIYIYKLYLELSPKGRLHWHGTINIKDKVNFYTYSIPHILSMATLVIKPIDKAEDWFTYCTKQSDLHDMVYDNHYTKMPITNIMH